MFQSRINPTQIAIALLFLSSSLSGCTDAGVQDNLPGCTNSYAVNYDENATTDDNSCTFDSDGDGVLDHLEVDGCIDVFANNHDPLATDDDGSCDYDLDDDGILDEDEVEGCTNPAANNHDPLATDNDGSCDYDLDDDGILDEDEVEGCTNPAANNHDPLATDNDGSCDRITVWVGEHYFLAYTGNDTSTLYQYQVIDLQYHVTYDEWGNELPENESYILDTTNIEITWKEWPGKADGVPEPPHFIWWSPAFLNTTNGTIADITITLPEWQGQDALGEEHLTMDITNFTEGWYEGEITWWTLDFNHTITVDGVEMPWILEIKDRDFELNLPIVVE